MAPWLPLSRGSSSKLHWPVSPPCSCTPSQGFHGSFSSASSDSCPSLTPRLLQVPIQNHGSNAHLESHKAHQLPLQGSLLSLIRLGEHLHRTTRLLLSRLHRSPPGHVERLQTLRGGHSPRVLDTMTIVFILRSWSINPLISRLTYPTAFLPPPLNRAAGISDLPQPSGTPGPWRPPCQLPALGTVPPCGLCSS